VLTDTDDYLLTRKVLIFNEDTSFFVILML